ncbi:MAG: argininosuccinate lyase [Candidatus Dormibacteria bacterium]
MPKPSEPALEAFTRSLPQDLRLAAADLAGSRAHARALLAAGLLDGPSLALLERGLDRVAAELEQGEFQIRAEDEDIHMAVERRLVELVGEPGQRLHTGRSRNDQVALDLRLWCRRAVVDLSRAATGLQAALLLQARRHQATLVPGYTHLQRAQPIRLGHHLLAYFEMLERDLGRLRDADRRIDSSPLGSGALAGSTLAVDRRRPARELGFSRLSANSLDAVSDRDFAAELAFVCALLGVHLSRLAEDLVLWNSQEFGFLTLPDRWATGSSLMPHKKNPDALELVRARAGRPLAALVGILTVLKGLPLSYNRDLQEDREHLFGAVDSVRQSLELLAPLLRAVRFERRAMGAAATASELLATDLAEHLVQGGVPFRLAHGMVGRAVRQAQAAGTSLAALVAGSWRRFGFDSAEQAAALFDPERSLRQRRQPGSPGPVPLGAALGGAAGALARNRGWVRDRARRLPN